MIAHALPVKDAMPVNDAPTDYLDELFSPILTNGPTRRRPSLMVTWTLGEEFGGLTAMCLRRSSIFSDNGAPSAVITFDANPHFRTRVDQARAEDRISSGVPIVNLHEFYAAHESRASEDNPPSARTEATKWVLVDRTFRDHDGTCLSCVFEDADAGELTRREYYRPDGTLYLVDCQLPAVGASKKPRRVLQLMSRSLQPVAEFPSAAKLYRYWLSELIGGHEVDVIVDSSYAAGFLWPWEHAGATKTTVFHSTHVRPGQDLQTGALTDGHQVTIDHRSRWDRIVMLTHSQADAFRARFGQDGNIAVIGNPVGGPVALPAWESRDHKKVLIVGRLTEDKRVEKAIEVVDILKRSGHDVDLEIVGSGGYREALESQVSALGLEDRVHFAGHVSDTAERLNRAGIALLCSRSEGQSLALLEAKTHGCVPISFDVDFGPRDVITHGVSGLLVPDGDAVAMAKAMRQLLDDRALHRRMSNAAFEEAQGYGSQEIYRQWLELLERAREHHVVRRQLESSMVCLAGFALDDAGSLKIVVRDRGLPRGTILRLVLQRRSAQERDKRLLVPADGTSGSDSTFTLSVGDRHGFPDDSPVDVLVEAECAGVSHVSRLGVRDGKAVLAPFFTGFGNLSIR